MRSLFLLFVLFLLSRAGVAAQDMPLQETPPAREFFEANVALTGLYELPGEHLTVGLIPEAELIYVERIATGDMRFLERGSTLTRYRYSPTRNVTAETDGYIDFDVDADGNVTGITWTAVSGASVYAPRVAGRADDVRFANGDSTMLAGTLLLPSGTGPFAGAVVIPQSSRSDLWHVGLWLYSRGIAVLVYDQRNSTAGYSSGPEITGRYQDRQIKHAVDAESAVEYMRAHPMVDADRVGVIGWSGGGFIGAAVAASVRDLSFYVNIAGDASPGFEQASHLFASRLMREGYSDADVEAARALIDTHFGVAEDRVTWQAYQDAVGRAGDTGWYDYLSSRYSIPWSSREGALASGRYQQEWPPGRVYGRVSAVPTLGVFIQFDHSSSPSAPDHFFEVIRMAGNPDVTVAVTPNAHHGGFDVEDMGYRFDTSRLKRRSPLIADTVADWVERRVSR